MQCIYLWDHIIPAEIYEKYIKSTLESCDLISFKVFFWIICFTFDTLNGYTNENDLIKKKWISIVVKFEKKA